MTHSALTKNGGISSPRSFPFDAGTGFRASDAEKARRALKVFELLWSGVRAGQLTKDDISDVYFYSISKAITYHESWKRGKFWSVSAWDMACKNGKTTDLVSEHVLPRGAALDHALKCKTVDEAKEFILKVNFECVITPEENQKLNDAKLQSTGFIDSPWERYKLVDIKILDIQHPMTTFFLNDGEREDLSRLELLVKHTPAACGTSCKHCHPPVKKVRTRVSVANENAIAKLRAEIKCK